MCETENLNGPNDLFVLCVCTCVRASMDVHMFGVYLKCARMLHIKTKKNHTKLCPQMNGF
jgi:hypothetical protein